MPMQILSIIAAPFIAAIVSFAIPILQRKWAKEDRQEDGNKTVIKKLDDLSKKIDMVETKVSTLNSDVGKQKEAMEKLSTEFQNYKEADEAFQIENENKLASSIRVRILRADDDLCNKNTPYPSEGYFAQIMQDCDDYEAHIEKRKQQNLEFKNGIAESSIEHIREVYKVVKANRLFGETK